MSKETSIQGHTLPGTPSCPVDHTGQMSSLQTVPYLSISSRSKEQSGCHSRKGGCESLIIGFLKTFTTDPLMATTNPPSEH